jgi:hypothetical protein
MSNRKLAKEMLLSGDYDERAPYLRKISSNKFSNKLCKCCKWCPNQKNSNQIKKCPAITGYQYDPSYYMSCRSYEINDFKYYSMFLKNFIIRSLGGFIGCAAIAFFQHRLTSDLVFRYFVITFVIQTIWVLILIKAKKWEP